MTLSNQQGPLRPAAANLIHMTLRRAILAAADDCSDTQSRIDCAELALALDLRDEARLLFETAFIVRGYDSESLAIQEQLRRETLLWELGKLRSCVPEKEQTGLQARIEGAAAELADCLAIADQAVNSPINDETTRQEPIENQHLGIWTESLARHVHALHLGLQGPMAPRPLNEAVRAVASNPLVRGGLLARGHVDAPVSTLVGLLAAQTMRDFLQGRHILLAGRLASPALIHKAAGLARAGLGPWFSQATHLVPNGHSLIGLVAAASTSRVPHNALQRGLALLSVGLNRDFLADFVDLLADEGLLDSLRLIAERYCSTAASADRPILLRLRDAAIDLGAGDLAVEVQTLVLRLSPFSKLEANVLLELQTTDVTKGYSSTTGRRDLRRVRQRALQARPANAQIS